MSSREDQLLAWKAGKSQSSRARPLQPSTKGNLQAQNQQAPSGIQLRKARPASRRLSAGRGGLNPRGPDKENANTGPAKAAAKSSVSNWKRSTESKLDVLTDALQVLKRDSLRPAINGKQPRISMPGVPAEDTENSQQLLHTEAFSEEASFQHKSGLSGAGLAQEAAQLFGDAELVAAFQRVQDFQLQRTSNGATDKSRIVELAGAACFVAARSAL